MDEQRCEKVKTDLPALIDSCEELSILHADAEQTVENLNYRIPLIEKKIKLLQNKLEQCSLQLVDAKISVEETGVQVETVSDKIRGCCIR